MKDFIPTTFRMDMTQERNTFFGLFTQQEGKRPNTSCRPHTGILIERWHITGPTGFTVRSTVRALLKRSIKPVMNPALKISLCSIALGCLGECLIKRLRTLENNALHLPWGSDKITGEACWCHGDRSAEGRPGTQTRSNKEMAAPNERNRVIFKL